MQNRIGFSLFLLAIVLIACAVSASGPLPAQPSQHVHRRAPPRNSNTASLPSAVRPSPAPRRTTRDLPPPHTHAYLTALTRECLLKQMTYNFSVSLLADRAPLVEAFDALRLGVDCGLPTPTTPADYHTATGPTGPFNVYVANGAAAAAMAQARRQRQQQQRHAAAGVEVYVDAVSGDDGHDGSQHAPVRTLAQGVRLTRGRDPTTTPATVYLRAGKHYVSTPVELTAADSYLTITNYANEQVTVSGAAPLRGLEWVSTSGGVFAADVSQSGVAPFSQLFVNGRRAIRARYPNGNPETMGLHTNPTGYMSASGWTGPSSTKPATELKISTPTRSPSNFGSFQMGFGGDPCSLYDPPQSVWCIGSPPAGSRHTVPVGVTATFPHKWAHPETAILHAFHSGHWEGWQFAVASRTDSGSSSKLTFSKGGFQGARGSGSGAELYVENVFEELDAAGEWFLDEDEMRLYYYPNATDWQSSTFEAAQLPSVLRAVGAAAAPVTHLTLNGLTFAHTATTFLEAYDVPSGGDWSIHRDGTVYLEGTEDVLIENCLFYSLGSSGVFLNAYNRRAHVTRSEFVWLAENAVAAFGKVQLMDGTLGTQPYDTTMDECLVHEIGVFGKQVSAFAQSLAARSTVEHNVFFNGPRAAVNFNDGFGGGSVVAYNSMFNWVRETSDHGPFNSWDRLPYLMNTAAANFTLTPDTNRIHHNLVLGNYHVVWPLDHDDGSCFFEDTDNVLVWGGFKNYLGHDKKAMHNLYLFPDMKSLTDGVEATMGASCCESDSGAFTDGPDTWSNNTCVLATIAYPWDFWSCSLSPFTPSSFAPLMSGNTIYLGSAGGQALGYCGNGGSSTFTLAQLQAAGYEKDTVVSTTPPSDASLVQMARTMLNF